MAKQIVFFIEGVNTQAPIEYIQYLLCKEFGWTYQELMEQPTDFVENILTVMSIVNKKKNGK